MARHFTVAPWTVLPHGPWAMLEDNLWVVEGDLPGQSAVRRRMTVIKLSGGKLMIHSAIALGDSAMQQLEAFGEPAVLVVPNGWHRIDAAAYRQRYQGIKVYCPAHSHRRVAQIVPINGHYDALPADSVLRVEPLVGMRNGEAVFIVRSGSTKTIVFNDALFNLPHQHGFRGLMLRLLGSSGGLKLTAVTRLLMVSDAQAMAYQLRQLAREPQLKRLIVSHGEMVEQGAEAALQRVAQQIESLNR